MSEEKPLPRRVRYLLFALLATGLLWAVVSHTFVVALARIEPTYALQIRSDHPGALEALADLTIDEIRRVPASGVASTRLRFTGAREQQGIPAPASEGNGLAHGSKVED